MGPKMVAVTILGMMHSVMVPPAATKGTTILVSSGTKAVLIRLVTGVVVSRGLLMAAKATIMLTQRFSRSFQ